MPSGSDGGWLGGIPSSDFVPEASPAWAALAVDPLYLPRDRVNNPHVDHISVSDSVPCLQNLGDFKLSVVRPIEWVQLVFWIQEISSSVVCRTGHHI